MLGISRESRRELWRQRLERYAGGNQTVADFCQQEQVSVPSFYYWKKRLRSSASPVAVSPTPEDVRNQPGFTEVLVRAELTPAQARLPGGITITLGSDERMAGRIVNQLLQHACGETGEAKRC